MSTTNEDDDRVMTLVDAALRLKAEERQPYVQSICGADYHLCNEVMAIVQHEEQMGGFLRTPALSVQQFARPFFVGEVVANRFEIVREIGEGGMAVVYEVSDRVRKQAIAIKASKMGFQQMLLPEVEGALKVRHRNVCLVNELHTAATPRGKVDFVTMELLSGETLSDHLEKKGMLVLNEATEIARQLCLGLAAAHAAQVVHRDLKPANVMLCQAPGSDLRVVIMDFGLSGEPVEDGQIRGTIRYIAPEIWLGRNTSKASDLYALGIILFEMVNGRAPSAGDSKNIRATSSNGPYWQLVQGCLSLDPNQRIRAFDKALNRDYWKQSQWTRRNILTALSATAACTLVAGAWFDREQIENFLHPLPSKRFVAIIDWPAISDSFVRPFVSGAIDAIENQLSRAEKFDRQFFVISSQDREQQGTEAAHVRAYCASLNANLALAVTARPMGEQLQMLMQVLDAKTMQVFRQRWLNHPLNEISSLAKSAVQTAADLLDVRRDVQLEDRLRPGTQSAAAFQAFQTAEELRKKPNDDGLQEAIQSYIKAVDEDSQFALAYGKLAIAYIRLEAIHPRSGAIQLAKANAAKAIQLDSTLPEGHQSMAFVWRNSGVEDEALKEMQKALDLDPGNPRILLWQAQLLQHFNRLDKAKEVYFRLKADRPNYWLAYSELGELFLSQGQYLDAIDSFKTAVTLGSPQSALMFNNLSALYLKIDHLAEAHEAVAQSLSLKKTSSAYSSLAEIFLAEGRYAEAAKYAQEAIDLEAGIDQYWLDLGDAYDSMPGMKNEALAAYKRAAIETENSLRTNPTDGTAWIHLALYRIKVGQSLNASSLIPKFTRFPVSDIDANLVKARVFELLGKQQQALVTLSVCRQQGATLFEIGTTPDLRTIRKKPVYAKLFRQS